MHDVADRPSEATTLMDLLTANGRLVVTCRRCGHVGYPILAKVAMRAGLTAEIGHVVFTCASCLSAETTAAAEFPAS